MSFVNFFNLSLNARGSQDLLDAESLYSKIIHHDGSEAYHCAFDLVFEELEKDEGLPTVKGYQGTIRGSLSHVWFDFDNTDPAIALLDARKFVEFIKVDCLTFFSGSKGFHVGVPESIFGIEPSKDFCKQLRHCAGILKRKFPSLDTAVFNPQRKFRAPFSRHPKTGLFKSLCNLNDDITTIKNNAQKRVVPNVWFSRVFADVHKELAAMCVIGSDESIPLKSLRHYATPEGSRAMSECLFLKHCSEDRATLSEPEWYAAAGIVGRFKDGREKFQALSKGHKDYSPTAVDEKLTQALQSAGPRTCKGINSLWGGCTACPHFEKISSPICILEKEVIATEATGFYFVEVDGKGKEKRTPDFEGLVKAFSRDYKFFNNGSSQRTHIWEGTHYCTASQMDINAWCEQAMNPKPNKRLRSEFLAKVQATNLKKGDESDRFFFGTTKGKLNLKNGILHIVENVVTPHDENVGFQYVLPYDYDPNATCPKFERFLDEITLGRKELQQTLLEFLGYLLWPSYDDHCFLWLSGGGRNGKSTFMQIARAMVGENNASGISLNLFEKSNYIEMMNRKLVNISEESDLKRINSQILGMIKSLSSGSPLQVDQKYQLPYVMRPTAKLIFASNNPPNLSGTEDALKSRMIIVPFDLKLEEHGIDGTTSKINWELINELESELPGILNLALVNLRNFVLRRPRKISRGQISHAAMHQVMCDSDPFEAWFHERVIFTGDTNKAYGVDVKDLYADYCEHYEDAQYKLELRGFAKRLNLKCGNKIHMVRMKVGNDKKRIYYGISLSDMVDY